MIDVVLDLELEAWIEHERAEATRCAMQRVELAQHRATMVRRMYEAGDQAHALGDDELAERLWTAARLLHIGVAGELEDGTPRADVC